MSCPEPVSWLRLERRQLGELGAEEDLRIDQHLSGCADCEEAARQVQASVPLRPLPEVPRPAPWRPWWPLMLAAPAAAGALLVLGLRSPVRLKGSDVALTLVRDRAGDVEFDPHTFSRGDRFKLLLTCPTPHDLLVQVAVFQEGRVYFPFPDRPALPCGNRVPLPGALTLTGGPATICVLWGDVDRPRLQNQGEAALPPDARCERLTPR